MNRNLIAALTACGLAAVGTTAAADDHDFNGRWYINPAFVFVGSDDSDPNSGYGGHIGFGKEISELWDIEGSFHRTDLELNASHGGGDYQETGLGVNALARFNRGSIFEVFGLAGIGAARTKFTGGLHNNDPYVDIGGGFQINFGERSPVGIRTDLRYRSTINGEEEVFDSYYQWVANLGVMIYWGGGPAAVPAAAPQDSDSDGVIDELDDCQNTPPGSTVDASGCKIDEERGIVLQGVNFEIDSATLTSDARRILDEVAEGLVSRPDVKAEIAGHTDWIGRGPYNQKLSQRRANAVRDYLINQGVSPENLTAKGYGESDPKADNRKPEGRRLNRRVELRITDSDGGVIPIKSNYTQEDVALDAVGRQ